MPSVSKKATTALSIIAASVVIAASSLSPANAQLSALRHVPDATSATASGNVPLLQVAERWRPRQRRDRRRRHRNDDAAIIGGIIGLTTGLIIGGALNQPYYDKPYYGRSRTYYDYGPRRRGYFTTRPRVYYAPPPPVYRQRYAAWSPEWYAYCARKYRSFNPRTGYFLAYSGRYRFCR